MKDADPLAVPIWHIIEWGDRWYQAALRFTRSEAVSAPGLIRRWDPTAVAELISWAQQAQAGRAILLWEIPVEPQSFLRMLEAIATISRVNPSVVQLAQIPASCSSSNALVVQEAGAAFLLDDLWTLEKVIKRLSCAVALPLRRS